MSRRGNCLDNAAMESFFGTLKADFYHMSKFRTLDELRVGLQRYIRYYNCDPTKLKLGGISPVEYRHCSRQYSHPVSKLRGSVHPISGVIHTMLPASSPRMKVTCPAAYGSLPYLRLRLRSV